ncbi:MAG: hypothetical protein HQL76_03710 [Magnetococcales bacterium]|nr:hypothetical protein [Magnetococcales bacterium]
MNTSLTPTTVLVGAGIFNEYISTISNEYSRLSATDHLSDHVFAEIVEQDFPRWLRTNHEELLRRIARVFGNVRIAVRSSANEDSNECSNAGRFRSILNVEISDLARAMGQVAGSYLLPNYVSEDTCPAEYNWKNQHQTIFGAFLIQEMIGSPLSGSQAQLVPLLHPALIEKIALETRNVMKNGFNDNPVDMEWVIVAQDVTVSVLSFSMEPNTGADVVTISCAFGAGVIVQGNNNAISTYYHDPDQPEATFVQTPPSCSTQWIGKEAKVYAVQARQTMIRGKTNQSYIQQINENHGGIHIIHGEPLVNSGAVAKGWILFSQSIESAWHDHVNMDKKDKDRCAGVVVMSGSTMDHYAILFRENSVNVFLLNTNEFHRFLDRPNQHIATDPQNSRLLACANRKILLNLPVQPGVCLSRSPAWISADFFHFRDMNTIHTPSGSQPSTPHVFFRHGIHRRIMTTINFMGNCIEEWIAPYFDADHHRKEALFQSLNTLKVLLHQANDATGSDPQWRTVRVQVNSLLSVLAALETSINRGCKETVSFYYKMIERHVATFPRRRTGMSHTFPIGNWLEEVDRTILQLVDSGIVGLHDLDPEQWADRPEMLQLIHLRDRLRPRQPWTPTTLPEPTADQEHTLAACQLLIDLYGEEARLELTRLEPLALCASSFSKMEMIQKLLNNKCISGKQNFSELLSVLRFYRSIHQDIFCEITEAMLLSAISDPGFLDRLRSFDPLQDGGRHLVEACGGNLSFQILSNSFLHANPRWSQSLSCLIDALNNTMQERQDLIELGTVGRFEALQSMDRVVSIIISPLIDLIQLAITDCCNAVPGWTHQLIGNSLDAVFELYDDLGKMCCNRLARNDYGIYDVYLKHLNAWFSTISRVYAHVGIADKERYFSYISTKLNEIDSQRPHGIGLNERTWNDLIFRYSNHPINIHQIHNVLHQSELELRGNWLQLQPIPGTKLQQILRIANRFALNENRLLRVSTNRIELDLALSKHKSLARLSDDHCLFEFIELPSLTRRLQGRQARIHSFVTWLNIIFNDNHYNVHHQFHINVNDQMIRIRIDRHGERLNADEIVILFENVKTLFDCSHHFARCPTDMVDRFKKFNHSKKMHLFFILLRDYCRRFDYSRQRHRARNNYASYILTYVSLHPDLFDVLLTKLDMGYKQFLNDARRRLGHRPPFKQNYFRHWKTMNLEKVLLLLLCIRYPLEMMHEYQVNPERLLTLFKKKDLRIHLFDGATANAMIHSISGDNAR